MSSQARIRANRNNAKRSTGPLTPQGKEHSKYNALKHGLSAKALILPWEEPSEFHAIRGALFAHYQPQNPIEAFLVDQVSQHWWRINRSRQFETRMMSKFESPDPRLHPSPEEIENFRRYDTGTDRAFYRCLDHLEKMLRRRPRETPTPAEPEESTPVNSVGFVSANNPPASAANQDPQPAPTLSATENTRSSEKSPDWPPPLVPELSRC